MTLSSNVQVSKIAKLWLKINSKGMVADSHELTHKKGNFTILEYLTLPHNYVTEYLNVGDIMYESTFEKRIPC